MGKQYHYTYRIRFPAQRWFYFGLHSTDDLNDGYIGSPIAHSWKWECFAWEMEILEFFDTREEAAECELRLIRPFLNDPQCLNESAGRGFSLEASRKGGRSGGTRVTEKHISKQPEWKTHLEKLNRHNAESGHLKRIANQRWISTIDGYISNAAGVAYHNRKYGYDPTAKRKL